MKRLFESKKLLLIILVIIFVIGSFAGGVYCGWLRFGAPNMKQAIEESNKRDGALPDGITEKTEQSNQKKDFGDLTGWKIIARNGDQVHSGTQYSTKIQILARDGKGHQKILYTFNDKANEKQEMEIVRFLNFDSINEKLLIYYSKRHDICKTGTPELCEMWDYSQTLENGIFNLSLTTGTLEKMFDFGSNYEPQSVVYDGENRGVIHFTEVGENQDTFKVYTIQQDWTVKDFITINNDDTNWNLVYFPSFASFELITTRSLCFRSTGTHGSKDWSWDFEGRPSNIYVAKCSEKADQDHINFEPNSILEKIQEIEFN